MILTVVCMTYSRTRADPVCQWITDGQAS